MKQEPSFIFMWLAIWSGITVSCIYFCQPLLHIFAKEFQIGVKEASLVATFTQTGYAFGIFLLVPLGDFFSRKKLILTKMLILALANILGALATSLPLMLAASFLIGIFATTAQDVIPIAADLAPEKKRAQYIGYAMSGLTLGILLSRTFSGLVSEAFGWRSVFVGGSLLILFTFVSCYLFFPQLPIKDKPASTLAIYKSMFGLFRDFRALRIAVLRHGLLAITFSGFWSSLSFFLSGEPYFWNTAQIGLMGFGGALGTLAPTLVGGVADRKGPIFTIRFAMLLAFASFILMGFGKNSLACIIAGVIFFDVAVFSSLISHQAIIYSLKPEARGRINSLFVSILFIFFAFGSYSSALVWSSFGWYGLMVYYSILSLLALALTLPKHHSA